MKNNLQTVAALLRLQARRVAMPELPETPGPLISDVRQNGAGPAGVTRPRQQDIDGVTYAFNDVRWCEPFGDGLTMLGSMAHRDRLLLRAIARHASHLASGQHVDLPGLAATMRQRLAAGEGLDALLPEAFNAMCEAYRRTTGHGPGARAGAHPRGSGASSGRGGAASLGPVETTKDPASMADGIGQTDPSHLRLRRS
ncbi:hypothetical protein [Micromonospora luteifusca]|uniref:hypothetical protein n=1 Tax=Micromonospora luteifusca TaxID=709860 RepID=UPI0033BAA37E